jgi:hypothetical protein
MNRIKNKAFRLGAYEFGVSNVGYKKFYVIYKGKKINFGDKRYQDFTQHNDLVRRSRYRARASKIKNKKGELTFNNKLYSNYWAYHLLW